MIWFPRIHREIVTLTQNCKPCIKIGKNLKPKIPKSKLANLPPLNEPNEEIQMDFAGPILDEQNNDSYILASVDRFSRYPNAKLYHNCDTDTAIKYLEKFIKFHGMPRNIRCDQAQAFKSRQFEIFCNNHNIKLILAPAGDHRANELIERLIQTIKRRLSVLNNDPKWSQITLADKITEIFQEIKFIPNTTTKIAPFTAHFGRKLNTPISNITSRTSPKNLSYNEITKFHLDLDRNTRKNTVVRKNDSAIVNETKPRLMHFVACKTAREYNRNQEKKTIFVNRKETSQTFRAERPTGQTRRTNQHKRNPLPLATWTIPPTRHPRTKQQKSTSTKT